MDSKLTNIIRGVVLVVLGVLVAVCGVGAAVNTYIGVVAIVAGVLLLAFTAYSVAKRLPLPAASLVTGAILITIAVALFMGKLSFEVFVGLLIFGLMGLGFGLVALGIFEIARRFVVLGISELFVGGLLILFTALYLGIPEFQTAFWIIVGILMIVFGVFVIVFAFVSFKTAKKK